MYTEGSRELPRSVAAAARLARSLMSVLTLFAIKDGVSSWTDWTGNSVSVSFGRKFL